MKKNYRGLLAGGFAAMIMITGCNKDEETLLLEGKTEEEKQAIAIDIASEQYETYAGFESGMMYADEGLEAAEGGRMNQDCYTMTYNVSESSVAYTLDFGDGCTTPDGQTIRGALQVDMSFVIDESNISMAATYNFLNYEVDGHIFSGKLIIDGLEFNADMSETTNFGYNLAMVDAKHTYPDGTHTLLNREWRMDVDENDGNIFRVTGASSGKTRIGLRFSASIDEALEVNQLCGIQGLPVAGIWSASVAELGDISIDYGNGACDEIVTLTYNGTDYEIDVVQ
ncbi:hypothetical protein AB9P05_05590 [Roseivirga sp. BDSF3-8]|uniref:hypothetical protein n=1 Tax=Roseivirga sp. BDSF3-8 TaxID=3241598 RepID=UPI003531D7C6